MKTSFRIAKRKDDGELEVWAEFQFLNIATQWFRENGYAAQEGVGLYEGAASYKFANRGDFVSYEPSWASEATPGELREVTRVSKRLYAELQANKEVEDGKNDRVKRWKKAKDDKRLAELEALREKL